MDGTRNIDYIKNTLKQKNIISSTYDSINILNEILCKLDNYVIFIDEFHNLSFNNLENKSDEINKLLINDKNKIIFMSATPLINDKYYNFFGTTIFKYEWSKAIEKKYICDFKIILPKNTNDAKIFNDLLININYNQDDKPMILKSYFLLKNINYYKTKKIILYASSIDEAKIYCDIIKWMKNLVNVNVEINVINYKTSKLKRFEIFKKFKTSLINQILINVQILNEGIDLPNCDCVFITKPNENIHNMIQRMSRCNRIIPNKKICYILIWCCEKKINQLLNTINDTVNFSSIYKNKITKYNFTDEKYFDENEKKTQNVNNEHVIKYLMNINCFDKNIIDEILNIFNQPETNIKKYLEHSYLKKTLNFFDYDNNKINFIIDNDNNIWFKAKQICLLMGYKQLKRVVSNNVNSVNKMQIKNINVSFDYKGQPDAIFINENGLMELLYSAKNKKTDKNQKFSNWVKNEFINKIKKLICVYEIYHTQIKN